MESNRKSLEKTEPMDTVEKEKETSPKQTYRVKRSHSKLSKLINSRASQSFSDLTFVEAEEKEKEEKEEFKTPQVKKPEVNVLIAEDNRVNFKMINQCLIKFGNDLGIDIKTTHKINAEEAYEEVQKNAANYAVIISDDDMGAGEKGNKLIPRLAKIYEDNNLSLPHIYIWSSTYDVNIDGLPKGAISSLPKAIKKEHFSENLKEYLIKIRDQLKAQAQKDQAMAISPKDKTKPDSPTTPVPKRATFQRAQSEKSFSELLNKGMPFSPSSFFKKEFDATEEKSPSTVPSPNLGKTTLSS